MSTHNPLPLKAMKKRKKLRKRQRLTPYRSLRLKAWTLFSIYTRKSGADSQGFNECYTCGSRVHWTKANAGHYRHDAFDFDDRNVKCQCVSCNLSDKGRADQFYLHLIADYGQEEADRLRKRAKWNAYTRQQLEEIIKQYS